VFSLQQDNDSHRIEKNMNWIKHRNGYYEARTADWAYAITNAGRGDWMVTIRPTKTVGTIAPLVIADMDGTVASVGTDTLRLAKSVAAAYEADVDADTAPHLSRKTRATIHAYAND